MANKSNKKVTKVVIPAAGYGTRLLPVTKAIPKELLPIVDFPAIHYVVQEAVSAGINEILIIINPNKKAIIDYFSDDFELNFVLAEKNKSKLLKNFDDLKKSIHIHYVIQDKQKGLGDAISYAEDFVHGEPFGVILPDDLLITEDDEPSGLKQCINCYNKYHKLVLGVQEVPHEDTVKYGIIDIDQTAKNTKNYYGVKDVIEKPAVVDAPSDFALIGRYIFLPSIFEEIRHTQLSSRGEIELADAIKQELIKNDVYACNLHGQRYDVGSKMGLIKANLDLSLKHPEFVDYMKK